MNYMNSEENQGFLVQFIALTFLICYTWRFHWDVSWMFYHRKTKNCQNYYKILQILKISLNLQIRVYFRLWGWASFLSMVWFTARSNSEMSSRSSPYTPSSTINWPHHLCVAIRVLTRVREWCVIIGLPVPWVCLLCHHASHARSVPACQRIIPEVFVLPWTFSGCSSCSRCPEDQDIVPLCQMAQNPQDCTYGSDLFVMMILVCFPLSCGGLLAVFVTINCLQSKCSLRLGFVMEDNMSSICFGSFIIVHSWIIQYLIGENCFVNHNHICLAFLTIIWLALLNCFHTLHENSW